MGRVDQRRWGTGRPEEGCWGMEYLEVRMREGNCMAAGQAVVGSWVVGQQEVG